MDRALFVRLSSGFILFDGRGKYFGREDYGIATLLGIVGTFIIPITCMHEVKNHTGIRLKKGD